MFGGHSNLGWIIILGLLAGALAKLLMPGRIPGGCIVTILLGIAGALLAGSSASVGWSATGEGNAGFIGAVVGAILILLVYRLVLAPPPLAFVAFMFSHGR